MPPFLDLLEDTLEVQKSAEAVGTTRQMVWRHLRTCPWFKERWDELMLEHVKQPLRASLWQRAIYGTKRDGPHGEWTEHESSLTKFVAERLLPEMKADAPADPGQSGVLLVPGMLTEEEWRAVVERRKAGPK